LAPVAAYLVHLVDREKREEVGGANDCVEVFGGVCILQHLGRDDAAFDEVVAEGERILGLDDLALGERAGDACNRLAAPKSSRWRRAWRA
jgi:hypothetical protein